jgi:hypothetical protein
VVRAGAAQEQHRHYEGVGSLLGGLQEVRARVGLHVQGSGRERGGQGGAPPHPLGQNRRAHGPHQRPPTLPLLVTRGAAIFHVWSLFFMCQFVKMPNVLSIFTCLPLPFVNTHSYAS